MYEVLPHFWTYIWNQAPICMHKTIEVDKCCLPVYTTNTEVNLYLIRTDLHTEYSFENQEVRAPTALEI